MNKSSSRSVVLGKYDYIRTYFLINESVILPLLKEEIDQKGNFSFGWKSFINSKKLYDLASNFLRMQTPAFCQDLAHTEQIEDIGMEILTEFKELLIATPFKSHGDPDDMIVSAQTLEQAIKCFITCLAHLLFKRVHNGHFVILKGDREFTVNDDLRYEKSSLSNVDD